MQCTGILVVHENNTWQNSTANEGVESVGRGCLDLARGSQNIGDPFVHRCLCHRCTRNDLGAHAIMHPPARMLETSSHELCFFVPQRRPSRPQTDRRPANYANRSRTHYDSNSTNRTKFMQTRRQTDISYKQQWKSYKIPDFHTNMTDFITFK